MASQAIRIVLFAALLVTCLAGVPSEFRPPKPYSPNLSAVVAENQIQEKTNNNAGRYRTLGGFGKSLLQRELEGERAFNQAVKAGHGRLEEKKLPIGLVTK